MRYDYPTPLSAPSATPQMRTQPSSVPWFLLAWWSLYLIASPVYIFESGLPQPADGLMAIFILVLATGFVLRIPLHRDLYLAAACFLGWVAIVNMFWWSWYQDPRLLLSSVYYAYNFAIFIVAFSLFRRAGTALMDTTRIALVIAIGIQLAVIYLVPDIQGGPRALGTFNNPNQLGYWSLLAAACYLVALQDMRLRWPDALVLVALLLITAHSLSKAAIISFLILVGVALWGQGASRSLKLGLAGALVFGGLLLTQERVSDAVMSEGLSASVADRFEKMGERDVDSLAGRGYDRIWLFPRYLLAGAGEGAFERFYPSINNEMHSTFGTILFSYGVPGFLFFLLMLWMIFRRAELRHLAYFFPICLYGLTHQGLRFSLLWVFLGLVMARAAYRDPRQQPVARRPGAPGGRVV